MPTIELISVGAEAIPELPKLSQLQVLTETTLTSHRSLFQSFLNEHKGVIGHLGGLKCDRDGFWFASDLVRWERPSALRFREEVFYEVKDLARTLLESSPENLLLFLSDYQFGPDTPSVHQSCKLQTFFANHDQGKIEYNALYRITP